MAVMILTLLSGFAPAADVDVLIIGSTADGGDRFGGQSDPFVPTAIATELENILSGAGLGTVNVEVEERYATASDAFGSSYSYNLASWFHWPYPAGVETTTRWPKLRGETTEWDYVILIGDPHTMENFPGHYAHGVQMIAQEVAKGTNPAEVVLLMPWQAPGNTQSSVAHYKEVVYRAGRTGGFKVAPAALAWEADGSDTDTTHPSPRGAYICAASIYSRIWEQSAKNSTYTYDDTLADLVNTTVSNNVGVAQYSGSKMNFQNPWLMLGDKRRDVHYSEKGSSTESYYANTLRGVLGRAGVTYNDSYRDTYTSNTPQDDGNAIWTNNPMPIAWNHGREGGSKGYVINPSYWQLAFTYHFQLKSHDYADDEGNDFCLARIYSHEVSQANRIKSQSPTMRNAAWRLMWGQFHQKYPTVEPVRDNAWHVATPTESAVGAFIYTLYSGRCPVNPSETGQHADARLIGYQTAWRLGTGSSYAPGFKVMPSTATAKTVTPSTTETMSVQFLFPPREEVTVQISSSDTSAAVVGTQTLVFTPANYNVPQSVTVAGVDGTSASAPFTVDFITTSDDPAFHELSDSWAYTTTRTPASVVHTDNGTTSYTTPKNFPVTTNLGASGATSANTTLAGPGYGSLSWDGGNVVYTPDANYIGPDGFAFTSNNGSTVTTGYIHIDVIDGYPDGSVRVEATDFNAAEEGTDTGTWTLIREGSTAGDLDVNFTLGGSATLLDDYNLNESSPVTIPAGQSSVVITLTPVDDNVFGEQTETATLTIAAGSGYTPITSPATISIADNDNTVPVVDAGADQSVALSQVSTSPGLWYGTAAGNINTTTPNPESLLITNVAAYTEDAIADNTTEIYTGQIFDADGAISFTERIDDQTRIWIDGVLVLSDGNWSNRASTANLNLTPGWHDIEIRISNGGGGSGPVNGEIGIGYDPAGGTAWQTLADPGDGSFLRVSTPQTAVVDLDGTVTDPEETPGTSWTLVSSTPGGLTVDFGNASAVDTSATFTAAGTYVLRLTANDGYGDVYDECTITITDPGQLPEVSVSAPDASAAEAGLDTGTWTLSRTDDTTDPLEVHFTLAGTAVLTDDYTLNVTSPVTIPAGQSSVTITLTPVDDSTKEDAEVASLAITPNAAYTVGASEDITITDNDNTPPAVNAGADQTIPLGQDALWTPGDIATAAWYDASDAASIIASGDSVSQWNDKSGNANHMKQATGSDQPKTGTRMINGLNVLDFDGAGDWMQADNNPFGATINDAFVLMVMNRDGADDRREGFIALNATSPAEWEVVTWTWDSPEAMFRFFSNGGDNARRSYTPDLQNQTSLFGFYDSPTDNVKQLWINAVNEIDTTSRGATTVSEGIQIAKGQETGTTFDGMISEVIVIDGTVSEDLRQKLEGYLAHKWGFEDTLPGTHPYKGSPPGAPGTVVNLDGLVNDVDGDALTTNWTVTSTVPADLPVTFGNASSPTSTASFTAEGVYTLRLTADDGNEQSSDEVVITVGPPLPSIYATWAGGTFTHAFGNIDPTSNGDGDRRGNMMEFAFGTDPTLSDEGALAMDGSKHGDPTLAEGAGDTMEFYFLRRKDHGASGSVSYTVQFSTDLTGFTDSAVTPTVVTDSSLDATNYEVVKVPFPLGSKFGRVEVDFVP